MNKDNVFTHILDKIQSEFVIFARSIDYNKWKIYETKQIREIIRRVAPTAKTILYGSQARNEARSDSDIDLLILLDGEKMTLKDEESITLPLYELELKTGVSISPIVTLKKLWESCPFTPSLFILTSPMKVSCYERNLG